MLAVYKKEIKAYFHSIIGYLFIGFFLFIIGLYFFFQNIYSEYVNFASTLYGAQLYFILLIPMATMRILAEENHQKTDQLLFTSPVSVFKVIAGKYLASVTMMAVVMGVICLYPLVLGSYGKVNMKQSYLAILIFFLLGCAYMAIGMFISSVTDNQAFSAILTFVAILITSFASIIGQALPNNTKTAVIVFTVLVVILAAVTYPLLHNITFSCLVCIIGEAVVLLLDRFKPSVFDGSVNNFFNWITMNTRFQDVVYGMFSLSSVVYYISITFLFFFLTVQAIKKRRWC